MAAIHSQELIARQPSNPPIQQLPNGIRVSSGKDIIMRDSSGLGVIDPRPHICLYIPNPSRGVAHIKGLGTLSSSCFLHGRILRAPTLAMEGKIREPAGGAWEEVQHGPYKIQQRARSPYIQKSTSSPWILLPLTSPVLLVSEFSTFALWICYMTYETAFAWAIQADSPQILWKMWLMVCAEVGLTVGDRISCLDGILAGLFGDRHLYRPVLKLTGDVAPRVDVCVTACGEDATIIMDTVAAAAYQDYPIGQHRIFVLDDNQDDMLQSMVGALNERLLLGGHQQVVYLRRVKAKGSESFYKAGNLAFGLQESNSTSGAELFAALDADMIPDIDWLRRVVPYLILDDGMAMLCPGQVSHV